MLSTSAKPNQKTNDMQFLKALLLIINLGLSVWVESVKRKREEERQNEREALERDPVGWFDDHFGPRVQPPTESSDDLHSPDETNSNKD